MPGIKEILGYVAVTVKIVCQRICDRNEPYRRIERHQTNCYKPGYIQRNETIQKRNENRRVLQGPDCQ